MGFIQLTLITGHDLLINIDQIVEMNRDVKDELTIIRYGTDQSLVKESVDEIWGMLSVAGITLIRCEK